ncbi:MAG: Fic family protein [Deltaproteobacteria bacterium]|nr:Fic family protein [Deltaproteobacteria bacterium]
MEYQSECRSWSVRKNSKLNHNAKFQSVALAAFAHSQLVLIRPFADGNGGTPGLPTSFVLVNQGCQIINFEPKTRNRYYSAPEQSDPEDSGNGEFFTPVGELQLESPWGTAAGIPGAVHDDYRIQPRVANATETHGKSEPVHGP